MVLEHVEQSHMAAMFSFSCALVVQVVGSGIRLLGQRQMMLCRLAGESIILQQTSTVLKAGLSTQAETSLEKDCL